MQKKIEELDTVLGELSFPKLVDGSRLVVKRDKVFNKKCVYLDIFKEIPGKLHGNTLNVVASINIGQEDWFIKCHRHDVPTVIAATELVDIVVEKVFGMSCGYRI